MPSWSPQIGPAFFRVANAICPDSSRAWLKALHSESEVIDSRVVRLSWLLGACHFVALTNMQRLACTLAQLMPLLVLLTHLSLYLLTSAAIFAAYDYEILSIEDDVSLVMCAVSTTIVLSATGLGRAASQAQSG